MWHSTSGVRVNRLQNATCGVQKKRVVCNYITIYRTHILFIEHIHHDCTHKRSSDAQSLIMYTQTHTSYFQTHKHSHKILYYKRSPATSRPLNGHSAIIIPIIRRWRSPRHTNKVSYIVQLSILCVSSICFLGCLIVLLPGCTTWL